MMIMFVLCGFFIFGQQPLQKIHLGNDFSVKEFTSIKELIANPEKYFNKKVKFKGVVDSVCNEEGCFIDVVPEKGGNEGILVNFPHAEIKFPKNSKGWVAIVEGNFYVKVYPKARVAHWQHHGFRKGEKISKFSKVLRCEASAVTLIKTKKDTPRRIKITPFDENVVDLNSSEFETNGFGTGKKILQPGESVAEHSSRKYEEFIFCINGEIEVVLNKKKKIHLKKDEMLYIPTNTLHFIKNISKKPAQYIFVYRKKEE